MIHLQRFEIYVPPTNLKLNYAQAFGSCNHSELHVPTSHDGHFEVPVLVHVPKVGKGLRTLFITILSVPG